MPPFAGPRARLCCTRYPVNILMEPSSMRTGKFTVSSRLQVLRYAAMSSDRPSSAAASSNCLSATS